MLTLCVALAAGVGAVCRYGLDRLLQRRPFPWGIWVVNVSGSFLLGLLVGAAGSRSFAILGSGFAGGFTTLSTWAWDTVDLAAEGERRRAVLNVVASFAAGLAAAALGLALA